jgi:polar amino acid transport system substrate-binding protein
LRPWTSRALRSAIQGAPSDRILTREIKAAEIVRIPLSPRIATNAAECCARAGPMYSARIPASAIRLRKLFPARRWRRVCSRRFALRLPPQRADRQRLVLEELIAEAKNTGVVQKAIDANGLQGVNVAPNR